MLSPAIPSMAHDLDADSNLQTFGLKILGHGEVEACIHTGLLWCWGNSKVNTGVVPKKKIGTGVFIKSARAAMPSCVFTFSRVWGTQGYFERAFIKLGYQLKSRQHVSAKRMQRNSFWIGLGLNLELDCSPFL